MLIPIFIAKAETACGDLTESPFAHFLMNNEIAWGCTTVETEKGREAVCNFRCARDIESHEETETYLIPSVGYPDGIVVCKEQMKRKDYSAPEWVHGAIDDMVECVDPATHTTCGDILDGPLSGFIVNGTEPEKYISVLCADNVCTFSCGEGYIPTYPQTTCRTPEQAPAGVFDPNTPVQCETKPTDTVCGNVAEHYVLTEEQSFSITPNNLIVLFSCPTGKLAMPASAQCDPVTQTFEHLEGQPIRCY